MPRLFDFSLSIDNVLRIKHTSTCREDFLDRIAIACFSCAGKTTFGKQGIVGLKFISDVQEVAYGFKSNSTKDMIKMYSSTELVLCYWKHSSRDVYISIQTPTKTHGVFGIENVLRALVITHQYRHNPPNFTIEFSYPSLNRLPFFQNVFEQVSDWGKTYFNVSSTVKLVQSPFTQREAISMTITGKDIIHASLWMILWPRLYAGKRSLAKDPHSLLVKSTSSSGNSWYVRNEDRENHISWWEDYLKGNLRILTDRELLIERNSIRKIKQASFVKEVDKLYEKYERFIRWECEDES